MITKKRKNIQMVKYSRFRQCKWTGSNVIKMFENKVTSLLKVVNEEDGSLNSTRTPGS